MTDLLREAIADAKAVREVALANAKLALEEAFTPRLQSMIATKLSEEAEGDEEEHMTEEEEEEMHEGEGMDHESEMEEGEGYGEEPMEEADEQEDHMTEEEEEEEMPEFEPESEEEVDFDEDEEEEEIDEDLMEIIRQLEEELESSEIGKGDNKQPSDSASDDHTEMKKEPLVQMVNEEEEEEMHEEESEDDIDIQEIIRALREEEEEEKMHEEEEEETSVKEAEEAEKEEKLQEAYAVIQFLREKLNEVNLLNSKLLFSNKLFRSHSLTESQKMTVIENFDRAGSLREVKLVYTTLAEALKGKSNKAPKTPKRSIKESLNIGASRPQASTRPSKEIISESNSMTDRFKKLAGLI